VPVDCFETGDSLFPYSTTSHLVGAVFGRGPAGNTVRGKGRSYTVTFPTLNVTTDARVPDAGHQIAELLGVDVDQFLMVAGLEIHIGFSVKLSSRMVSIP